MSVNEIKQALGNWQQMVREYQRPDNWKAVVQLITSFLPFVGLWVLMYFSVGWSYLLTLGLGFLNAFFLVRIFIIQHDCGHQSFFKSRRWNNVIGELCSFFSLIPYRYWARSHNFHHGHNGMLEHRDIGDITTLTVKEYHALTTLGKWKYRLYRSAPVMFLFGPLYYILIHNRLPLIQLKGWKKARRSLIWSNLSALVFYLFLGWMVGWTTFLKVQLPITIFFAMVAIWFFYVQHQHDPNYKQWKDNWDYLLAALRGSTYYKLPRFVHWLTGNIGFHHIHHLNSLIPSYNLRKCHEENPVFEKYAVKIGIRESIKTIFNKLWDEENQRMISFREYRQLQLSGSL